MDLSELKKAVETVEVVDGHAHNIVSLDSSFPFLGGFSEAHGDALTHALHSLSVKRNLKDIAQLYGCENSLRGIEEFRRVNGLEAISSTCFKAAKISAILIDDGVNFDKEHDIEWHKAFSPFVGRILRIERLAETILDEELPGGTSWTLDKFTEIFVGKLKSVAGEIFGLKTIAAYRSGLEINPNVSKIDAEEGLTETLVASKPIRIENKNFIDFIFTQSLEVAQQFDLPMQIHTGFGDKDLDMRLSNPLHLRDVLEEKRFSKSRLVLLHASYPFSKEASYLASVYSQVYLDFGLALPKLSVHGMISSIKELLELAPINKVMFSTDGYAFPETYYLGAQKSREVIFSVLRDACIDGDLDIHEAVQAAKDIFAENSIRFYKLKLPVKSFGSANTISAAPTNTNVALSGIRLVRILWVDASGQQRCRVVPSARFQDTVQRNGVGLAFAAMGMPSFTDGTVEESKLTATGEMRLVPDLSTRKIIPWETREEMVLADMCLKPGEPWEYCPREALRRVSKILKEEFNFVMNAGFENEFFLLKSVLRQGKEEWVPFDFTPYSSTSSYDAASPIFQEIVAALDSLNIPVEQVHAESGKGQFEVVLGYGPCTLSADNLIFARETIRAIARKHGLLATFVPKYSMEDIGSGAHVHVSLFRDGKNVFMGSSQYGMSKAGEEFMAGVLYHLPRILAFIAPIPNSYDRLQPHTWSGPYQCWGRENKEVAVRAASPPGFPDGLVSNFEIRSFDGCANPHIGLAAILAAGIDGLRKHLSLPEPVDTDTSTFGPELKRLPESLSESLAALNEDNFMADLIGEKLLVAVKAIRKAEIDFYSNHKDAYKQLIYRY
ncbi:protein fluG-like [Cannabis sativa]|uniref:protein fluG-like n=1 Tax=Cannabis sativa TaxID=3483 RepID=UPI0029CA3AA6|nr:protein fluG-like [Cannabis sativa]